MANTIQIKRGALSNIGAITVKQGEFVLTEDSGYQRLFIGRYGTDVTGYMQLISEDDFDSDTMLIKDSTDTLHSLDGGQAVAWLSGKATGDFDINSHKITGLADPSADTDAVNLRTLHNAQLGMTAKEAVRVLADKDAGVDLSNFDASTQPIDGITLSVGDRVLITGQNDATLNGIYVVNSNNGLDRASDFNEDADIQNGAFVFVKEGTNYHDTGWLLTSDGTQIGTSDIIFTQFSGAGSYVGGTGIEVSGNVIGVTDDVIRKENYSAGNSLLVAISANTPDDLAVALNSVVGRTTGNITNIGIIGDLSSATTSTLVYSSAIKNYIDARKFLDLTDTPTAYSDGKFLRSSTAGIEFVSFDDTAGGTTGVTNNAPTSNAFYNHNAASGGVHGVPSGNVILHNGSLIDCGTF